MSNPEDTTLISLFHTQEHAKKALNDLESAGVPSQSIQILKSQAGASSSQATLASLKTLNLPVKDVQVLSDGLLKGGTIVVVRAGEAFANKVETIFESQNAEQIDERSATAMPVRADQTSTTNETVIPIVEEDLVVGKRQVSRGGVRVFTRLVETPVERQVTLREEHATLERHPVNRPISEAEINAFQSQSFEVHEMAEEAVVGKTARVVEEIHIGKESTERTEQIKDTVRKTQVEVDQIASNDQELARGRHNG